MAIFRHQRRWKQHCVLQETVSRRDLSFHTDLELSQQNPIGKLANVALASVALANLSLAN